MGYGQKLEGASLFAASTVPHQPARAAKEVERTHHNPVPEGTSPAPGCAAADPVGDGYAALMSR
jgi:hypothetical protein